MNHLGTVELNTPRLILRRFRQGDAEQMFRNYTGDPEVTRFLTWPTHTSVEGTQGYLDMALKEYDSEKTYRWAIVFEGEVIGCIDVVRLHERSERCEIGYCMGKKWWNRGIMTEALDAVMDFLFNRADVYHITAYHATDNPASGRVMRKCGMKYQGTLRAMEKVGDTFHDCAYYSILRDEYQNRETEN